MTTVIQNAEVYLRSVNMVYKVECECGKPHKWTVAPDFTPLNELHCQCGAVLCMDFVTRRCWVHRPHPATIVSFV